MIWLDNLIADAFITSIMFAVGYILHYFVYRFEKIAFIDNGVNSVEFEAPGGILPAVAGVYLFTGDVVMNTGRLIGATLIDLTARKYIAVSEDADGVSVLLRSLAGEEEALRPFEKTIIIQLVDEKQLRLEKRSVHEFYEKCVEYFLNQAVGEKRQLYNESQSAMSPQILLMGIFCGLMFGWILFSGGLVMSAISVVIFLPYMGIMSYYLYNKHTSTEFCEFITLKGRLEEYRRFLRVTQASRTDKSTPRDWDRGDAYVVALGLDTTWSNFFSETFIAKKT